MERLRSCFSGPPLAPRHVRQKMSARVNGGRAEGLPCADHGARPPNGVIAVHSGYISIISLARLCSLSKPLL